MAQLNSADARIVHCEESGWLLSNSYRFFGLRAASGLVVGHLASG
jgi:hypothetical protein